MTQSALPVLMLAVPLAAAAIAFLARLLAQPRREWLAEGAHLVSIVALAAMTLTAAGKVMDGARLDALGDWLSIDPLAAIFCALIGVVGLLTGLHSLGHMRHEVAAGEISRSTLCTYYGFFNLFLATMLLTVTANNIVMMWVAVEATTLGSAFLVGLYGRRASLEAAWKYVVICTVGVAFALYGTVLIYAEGAAVLADPHGAAFWTALVPNAARFDPGVMKLAFVFVLIGFGTKAGLFPMHAWLPDAHSEAPSPVSALLSGVLVKCALFVIIRYAVIVAGATGPEFPQTLFLVMGVLSVGAASFLVFVQRDLKRMLAYSTAENVGLIVLGLGIGGPLGIGAALLHTINHSLTKALMFCGSGNLLAKYGTRDLGAIKGVVAAAPFTGTMLIAGALALAGIPPFSIFASEFMLVTAGLTAGYGWLMVVCLLFLTVTLAALLRFVGGSLLGPRPETVRTGDSGGLELGAMAVLLALVVVLGVAVPQPVERLIRQATSVILQSGDVTSSAGTPVSKPAER